MTSPADTPSETWCHRYIYQLTFGTKYCTHCDGKVRFRRKYAWCKVCRVKISAKAATWLRGSKLSYRQIYQLILCWQKRKSPEFMRDALGSSYTTIRRWYRRFSEHLPRDDQEQLLIDLVEMDESFSGKKRYNNQKVVIGAIKPTIRCINLQIITDCQARTFEAFSEMNIQTKTNVKKDSHPSYNDLDILGCSHYSFNHSKGEYTHTNQIENLW